MLLFDTSGACLESTGASLFLFKLHSESIFIENAFENSNLIGMSAVDYTGADSQIGTHW